MKNIFGNIIIAIVVAGLIILAQWFVVEAGDDFTIVKQNDISYKVFSYGFPFKIVSCDKVIGLATPQKQIRWRQIGNWGTFFMIGLISGEIIRKFRTRRSTTTRRKRREGER